MERHVHADAIHAWADGYVIEKLSRPCCGEKGKGSWYVCKTPLWYADEEYRVRPGQDEHELGTGRQGSSSEGSKTYGKHIVQLLDE